MTIRGVVVVFIFVWPFATNDVVGHAFVEIRDLNIEDAAEVDYLVYLYFPGRNADVDDTHARMRPKYALSARVCERAVAQAEEVCGGGALCTMRACTSTWW